MLRKFKKRIGSVLHRGRFERELEVELQFHLDMLAAQNVRRGLAPDAARRAAVRAFGPVAGVKDHVRDTWLSRVVESFGQDIRYGLRMFVAAPAFAAAVILTIALAVGVNTAIFGVAYSILVRPPDFDAPDELVVLKHGTASTGPMTTFSPPELADYRRVRGVEAIAELHTMWFILLGQANPERVSTGVVSVNYFDVLGVRPILGRGLREADDAAGAPAVLVLSYEYWKRSFNGDPSIVGRVFQMNDRPHTVVGILPPFPMYPQTVDVYMPTSACPFRSNPVVVDGREMRMGHAIARLRDGITVRDFTSDIEHMSARLRERYPDVYTSETYTASASPVADEMRQALRPTLMLLIVTASLVLLIGCVSVSNLTMARLTHRSGEVSLRAALDATRRRIVCQLLTENVAVAGIGIVAGVLLAQAALGVLTSYVQRGTALPVDRGLNAASILSAIAVTIVLLFVSAAVPLFERRRAMEGALPRLAAGRIRYGLVVSQVGLSFVLMIAAAFSVRSLLHLQGLDVGFTTENVQTLRLDLNFTRYHDVDSIIQFWRRFERELVSLPGVVAAGGAGTVPLDGHPLSSSAFRIEAAPGQSTAVHSRSSLSYDALPRANLRVASPGYFSALGQRLLAGRAFIREDADARRAVVVVNESLARRHWPDGTAVGQRLQVDGAGSTTIVGVVENTRQKLDEAPGDEIYLPLLQMGQLSTNWLVRSSLAPADLERNVRGIVHGIDREQPVDNFRSFESFRDDSLLASRVTATVVSLFSVLALVITAIGIGGVIGFAVQQRRHEFGVRLALGAQRHRVVAMVIYDGLRLVTAGLTLGAVASLPLFPFMQTVLAGIEPFDPGTFALVACLLLLVAAAACFIPARRAASVDPLLTLRVN